MRNFLSVVALLTLLTLLSGCEIAEAWIGQSVEDAKTAADLKAKVLAAGNCGVGRGASNRLYKDDQEKLDALDLLCDGPRKGKQAPTMDAAFIESMQTIFGARQPTPPAQ